LPAQFISASPEETFSLGQALSGMLAKGSVVALQGPLGAGKTCFTKGIAGGLGIEEEITSPTYTIISEYEGKIADRNTGEGKLCVPVYHIDAYRLNGNDDFINLGGEEIVFGSGISIIEWSERIPGFIPPGAYQVNIEIADDNKRRIRICQEENS